MDPTRSGDKESLPGGLPSFKVILLVLIVLAAGAFAIKNLGVVEVNYYDYNLNARTLQTPLLFVILASFILGFLAAWLLGLVTQFKLKYRLRKQAGEIAALKAGMEKDKKEFRD